MTRMTFDQAVDFIVDGLQAPEHARRATRDKVRKRVRYGLGDGSLPRLDLGTTDVHRNELILWSRKKWPGKFTDTPVNFTEHCQDGIGVRAETDAFRFPSDIASCHLLLRQSRMLLQLLEAKCRAQEQIIGDLRPDAQKYRQMREKNRESAKKPRGG